MDEPTLQDLMGVMQRMAVQLDMSIIRGQALYNVLVKRHIVTEEEIQEEIFRIKQTQEQGLQKQKQVIFAEEQKAEQKKEGVVHRQSSRGHRRAP